MVAKRSNPMSKEQLLRGHRRAKRSYSTFEVRRGSPEEIPLIQGKGQQLCFAGAAVKRHPVSKVRETQVRRRCCERASEGRHTEAIITETSQSDHRTTAVSNSVRLSHAVGGHPGRTGHGGEL